MYRWFGFASGIVESSVMFKARCFFVMDLTMEVSMRSESTVSPFRYGLSRIMIDSSAVYAVIFFRSFVFLRTNFSRLPFSRRARSFSCATSRRDADAASFEAKVNSAMFSADKVSRCAILSNAFMRVWPSGKAKASQCFGWHVPLTSLANHFLNNPTSKGVFTLPFLQWERLAKRKKHWKIQSSSRAFQPRIPHGDDRSRRRYANARTVG